MLSNCGVIEDRLGCHGRRGNEQMGVGEDGSVLTLRKSLAERKMRLFGHIVRKNGK